MQIAKNKTMATMIALFLVLTVAVTLVALPAASAHTPIWEIPTFAYISVAPDPVGVGQQVIIVMWLDKPMSGAAVANNVRMHDYTLTITKPDNTTETMNWPIVVDSTSSQYTLYTPDQVGTYTLKFDYSGQTYNWSGAYHDDIYLPSSKTTTLTVQQEPIPAKITYPLPTEYWTRPIEGQNTAWASIASNYLRPFGAAYSFASERFQPDGTAPNSPHIMWTKPINFGGVVGGSNVGVPDATFYTGLSYNTRFNSPIIMNGRLYYELPSGNSGSGGGYVCVDLRTGEEIWWINITGRNIPSFGYLYNLDMYNQHGVIPDGWLFTYNFAKAYDPRTGILVTLSLTNVPSGTAILGPSGEELRYTLANIGTDTNPDWRLAQWNSSKVFDVQSERTIDAGLASRYDWTVSIEALPKGSTIRYAILDDVILGSANTRAAAAATMPTFGGVGTDVAASYATFWAISLKPDSRGSLLWIKNYSAPAGNITRQFGPLDPVNRVFLMSDKETMQWSGYSLDNGSLLWGPLGKTRDFNYYPTVGSGGVSQVGFCAYGNLYTGGYGGELFCYSTNNGTLLWKYNNTNSGLETPWGLYPLFPAAICDGKIYVYTNEHSPNTPYYKGARVRCLNATTGEEIWTMLGHAGVGGFSDEGWPVADGFLVYLDYYDMQLYCIGKGPSATTVEAPMTAVTAGNNVVIQGTVTDIAAGTKQDAQAARFPNGVPAVSDASMSAWMEYVYMQKPRPANATGVEVTIDAIDPNNNFIHIGTATSDASSLFSYAWMTPDVPGKYTVIATFAGSESYWPSYAETAMYVGETPPATPPPEKIVFPPTETYIIGATIAIIIAIAIAVVLLYRRH
jgi:outer membrane protein assembly factor BamB